AMASRLLRNEPRSYMRLAICQTNPFLAYFRSQIFGARANQAIVIILFHDVRGPAGHAADGEDRSEQVDWNPERIIHGGGIEVDVGVEVLGLLHVGLDLRGGLVELLVTGALAEILGHALETGGPRVERVIDAV